MISMSADDMELLRSTKEARLGGILRNRGTSVWKFQDFDQNYFNQF